MLCFEVFQTTKYMSAIPKNSRHIVPVLLIYSRNPFVMEKPPQDIRCPELFSLHRILQYSDAVDLTADHVPVFQVLSGFRHAENHTAGGSRGDDRSGL